jgi:ribonuclease P protein component
VTAARRRIHTAKPDRFFLHKSADIERLKRVGHRRQTPFFNLVSAAGLLPVARMGIIVGKRLGTAVVRNRARRIFRELARQVRGQLIAGQECLVFPRRHALLARHAELRAAWLAALREAGVLAGDPGPPCEPPASP